jgi:hypothetical protein
MRAMETMILIFNHTLMITGFVFVMMLVIEYVNILTRGSWQKQIAGSRLGQYVFASLMGAVPGCLGAFIVVAMYSHRMLSVGAVVAAMIATSGDEAYVMLAVIPRQAFLLMGLLFVLGIVSGILTDAFLTGKKKFFPSLLRIGQDFGKDSCKEFELHTFDTCRCFPNGQILTQWKQRSPARIALTVVLGIFIGAIISGYIGPDEWNWVRISILLVTGLALFIVSTVPEHFLTDHLWDHVARKHVPRIFLWTFGTLLVMHILLDQLHMGEIMQQNSWVVLGIASLIGLIPESGPHLIFVNLFANGTIPFGILLASSIVQDGHGMLPLLAHSPRAFIVIKLINLIVGFCVGAIVLLVGY